MTSFLPNSSNFNFKMQELTNVNSGKSEWCKNFTRFIIDIRKVLNYFTTKDVEKNNDRKRYLKCSEKVKTLPTRTSVKLSSKGEATFISDLLFQRLVFLPNSLTWTVSISPRAVWINNLNVKNKYSASNQRRSWIYLQYTCNLWRSRTSCFWKTSGCKIHDWSTPATLFQILGVLVLFLMAIQRI